MSYDSQGSIAFTVLHQNVKPTAEEIIAGLRRRIRDLYGLNDDDILEAVAIDDTLEVEDDPS